MSRYGSLLLYSVRQFTTISARGGGERGAHEMVRQHLVGRRPRYSSERDICTCTNKVQAQVTDQVQVKKERGATCVKKAGS